MELIIIIVAIIAIIIVNAMMKINVKEVEKIALDSELNEITKNYPKNIEICKTILKKLGNETTKREEDTNSEATLYIAIYKKMLMFNFVYTNIYLIYFLIICTLVVLKKLQNEMLFSNIFLILSFIHYVIRIYLENDAMMRAEYLAKEYMKEQNISSDVEIHKVSDGFKKLNDKCIKGTNCNLFVKVY